MAKKYKLSRINETGSSQQNEARFSINYEAELNDSQFEAVSSIDGSYLLIAGAGTGKTRTLVYRVARLVELGYDPKSILLLTFTRKAASEMMSRASSLLDERCARVTGGTFHSFANLTLRKYAQIVGLHSSFTILDQGDSEDVINLIRGQLDLAGIKKRFPKKNTINKVLSLSVNKGISIQEIIETEFPHFLEFSDKIIEIGNIFKKYKKENNLLDYDDLLIYLKEFLFTDSPIVQNFLNEIKFLMVDEYQDTNKLQADIIKGLARYNKNVMVVGDDSQSIYSFRGANFKNIMNFPKIFQSTKIIKLEQNYRSTPEILSFTNKIIDAAIEKYPKELYSSNNNGALPAIISATNDNMQSRFIVDKILELREEGVPLDEIAVLFRASYFSFDLEIELNKANIPFNKVGGMKFIETAHVKDVLSFLRIVHNPTDFISWYRLLLLLEGIGPKKAQGIISEITQGTLGIKTKLTKEQKTILKPGVSELFDFLNDLYLSDKSPAEKTEKAIDYYQPLFKHKYDDFNKRKKDLEIFEAIAANYKSLGPLLTDMALDPPRDSVFDVVSEDKDDEIMTLSTIHSAKGLEWHTVFIIHAIEGFFPSVQSYGNLDELEEERRLMYVAATRAKQNLYISYPMSIFDRQNGFTFAKPSRFIQGFDDKTVEEWIIEDE